MGTALISRILTGERGDVEGITVLSRNESKQHDLKMRFPQVHFVPGDIRSRPRVEQAVEGTHIIFHAAAMKHVQNCANHPIEATEINVNGTKNLIHAIRSEGLVEAVVGVSSDKGRDPRNHYGQTKEEQERLLLEANGSVSETKFVCVCYGNVMASSGSVIEIWRKQLLGGGPVTITDPSMTRFLISLDQAVDTLFAALEYGAPGEVYVPMIPAASIGDMAAVLVNGVVPLKSIGKWEGEKMHETLITDEEAPRVVQRGGYYVVTKQIQDMPVITGKYISRDHLVSREKLRGLLAKAGLLFQDEKVTA